MPRRNPSLAFEAIRIEGALLSADFLAQVAEERAGQQTPEAYGVRHGLTLRDEIGQSWRVAEAYWRDLQAAGLNRGARERALLAMLADAFGWRSLAAAPALRAIGDRQFPLTASALEGMVPVAVGDGDKGLDEGDTRFGDEGRRRSPFGVVQESLNAEAGSLWGIVTNGVALRIVRDNASLTRPAWIEADLTRIFGEQRYADFSLLWLLLHQSRFGAPGRPPHDAILEEWRNKSLQQGTAARERLREGVEQALLALGNGFLKHRGNDTLRTALTDGTLDGAGFQRELLRLIYRMIVLVVAEERDLLHPPGSGEEARRWYTEGYGMRRLRERAAQRRGYDRHDDLWDGLRVVFRGCATGEPRLALPGLGGLFAQEQCPHLDASSLGNEAILTSVFRLTWLRDQRATVRVNWRDMGTEELGSVYESLLELEPELRNGAREYGFVGGGAGVAGHARRLTGSYYTPDALVQALLDSALDPVIERAKAADDPQRALLALSVIDPAMGSGHFLLGASRRIAGHLARLRTEGTPGPAAYREALREVISHCVYGVDKNAMAVELARIALWLEAVQPGKPLAFLDHHLVHGDAILGILDATVLERGIPDEAFASLSGDDRGVARQLKRQNAEGRTALEAERRSGQVSLKFDEGAHAAEQAVLDAMPDDTLDAIAKKGRLHKEHTEHRVQQFRQVCDSYVAAFLLPKTEQARGAVPTTGTLRDQAAAVSVTSVITTAVGELAQKVPFLHWPITFAAVMSRGGFDCVLGNPPWEKLAFSEQEFFQTRDPEIAAATGTARARLIAGLSDEAPGTSRSTLYERYQAALRLLNATSGYVRGGRRFPLTGQGIVNLYALFAETALGLVHPQGRAGVLVPSGIATDAGTAEFFRHIADGRLISLIDFENREALFPAVDSRQKFSLLTLGRSQELVFAFFLTQPEQRFDERRRFTLTPEDLRRLNPNTGTAPIFRSKADAELTAKIYRSVPVLWDETRPDGNPWGLEFRQGLFNMTSDSGLFERQPGPGLVPLYEAKMIHQYDHRWATYAGGEEDAVREVTQDEKADPTFHVRPRYWVPQEEVEERLQAKGWDRPWLLGWRDICRATDERTFISSVLPRVGVGNKIPLVLALEELPADRAVCLLACLNSLVLDFCARQKIGGTTMNFYIVKQLPVPPPSAFTSEACEYIKSRVGALVSSTSDLVGLREELGLEPVRWYAPNERARLRAELDVWIAQMYGLGRDDLRYVLEPQDILGPGYPTETFRVLKDNDIRNFGEYRTRRLVLEAWDRRIGTR